METERFLNIQIPEDATLKDLIFMFNGLNIQVDIHNKLTSKWVYDHKDWVLED